MVANRGMPKKTAAGDDDAPKKLSTYTVKLDDAGMAKLEAVCRTRGWAPAEVAYTRFAFKGTNVNVSAYTSGKVVIAGKGTEEFVTMTLEPEVIGEARLGYDEVHHPEWFEAHAGLDESGKGDFFGPLVAATVIADRAAIDQWREAGVQDSKRITENRILELDRMIRATRGAVAKTVHAQDMRQYNDLMTKRRFFSQNHILAFQHARALQEALKVKRVPWGMLDQFTEDLLVQREMAKLGVTDFDLRMQTKAEADPVVAAASIVARAEYVRQMRALSEKAGEELGKGAGATVKAQGRQLVERLGAAALRDYAKLHFRTAYEIVSEAGRLDELPLPKPKERVPFKKGA